MFPQAFAAWRWWNHYEMLEQRKTLLRINMDESSICLHQGDGKGTIVLDRERHREDAVQRVSRRTRRRRIQMEIGRAQQLKRGVVACARQLA